MSVYLLDDDDPRFPPARLASPDGDGILAGIIVYKFNGAAVQDGLEKKGPEEFALRLDIFLFHSAL